LHQCDTLPVELDKVLPFQKVGQDGRAMSKKISSFSGQMKMILLHKAPMKKDG